jgi:hypothetical protein
LECESFAFILPGVASDRANNLSSPLTFEPVQ